MIITTTNTIEGREISEYKGLVFGEVVAGSNFIRDFFAGITDFIGGRSGAYESRLSRGREEVLAEMTENAKKMGANAIVGVEVNYTTITSENKSMFMIVASGTAVILR